MFDPCLSPLRSLYCPPLQGLAFTASPSTAAAIKPRGLQLGVKAWSGAGGALTGKVLATSHGTAAEPLSSLHQLLRNPGISSENSCPAVHRDTCGTAVGLGWLSEGDPSPKCLCFLSRCPAAPSRARRVRVTALLVGHGAAAATLSPQIPALIPTCPSPEVSTEPFTNTAVTHGAGIYEGGIN